MKFSFSLIKKLVPRLKSKKELVEKLNFHSFEAVDLAGDAFDAVVPPNRYSEASHIGIAREISAILGIKAPDIGKARGRKIKPFPSKSQSLPFRVEVKDKNLCPRYSAGYFENIKIKSSPKWLQKILIDCGLRPINNVVDAMNYAMLETGQPLHAFDYDKLGTSVKRQAIKQIIVRRAKKGEKITTLDSQKFLLDESILVIADDKELLAIAGIKGGKKAEVDKNTKKIIVESANFDSFSVYKASKNLKLATDASARFSRNLSPELAEIGLRRAAELLEGVCGAKAGGIIDIYSQKLSKKIVKFDVDKFNKFIGVDFDAKICREYLERLGFKIGDSSKTDLSSFFVEAPSLRLDIETFEDLAEEIIRLYGYNRLKAAPPRVHLIPSGFEDAERLQIKIRKVLTAFGLSETQNYSLIGRCRDDDCIELENPLSEEKRYLRNSLAPLFLKNIEDNLRFFEEIKIFEIGKIFSGRERREVLTLGVALASKNKENFFELKGMIDELFKKIGLVDYLFVPEGEILKIESGKENVGYLKKESGAGVSYVSLSEINLEKLLTLVVEEHEYAPLPKYPSAMRDVSAAFGENARIGDIVSAIQRSDLKYIEDVDLIDEYQNNFTFRIVFQAPDRTLTDEEINQKLKKISDLLENKFGAKIR